MSRDSEELERLQRAFDGLRLGDLRVGEQADEGLARLAAGPAVRYGLDRRAPGPDVWRVDASGWTHQAPSPRAFFAQLIALDLAAGEDVTAALRRFRWATEGASPFPAFEDARPRGGESQSAWFVRLGIAGGDHAMGAALESGEPFDGARERDHLRRFPGHVPALAHRLQRLLDAGDREGARAVATTLRSLPPHRLAGQAGLLAAITRLNP